MGTCRRNIRRPLQKSVHEPDQVLDIKLSEMTLKRTTDMQKQTGIWNLWGIFWLFACRTHYSCRRRYKYHEYHTLQFPRAKGSGRMSSWSCLLGFFPPLCQYIVAQVYREQKASLRLQMVVVGKVTAREIKSSRLQLLFCSAVWLSMQVSPQ